MYLPREVFPNLPISVFPNEGTTLRRTETTLFTPKAVMLSEEAMAGITPAPPGGRCQQMAAAFWESPRSVAHSPGAEGGAETTPGPHPNHPNQQITLEEDAQPSLEPKLSFKTNRKRAVDGRGRAWHALLRSGLPLFASK